MESQPFAQNHLIAVRELLYGETEPTEEQHLEIIRTGIGEKPYSERRRHIINYAEEHISDPANLLDIKLTVGEAAFDLLDSANISGTEPKSCLDNITSGIRAVVESDGSLDESAAARAFALISGVTPEHHKRVYHIAQYSDGNENIAASLISAIRITDLTTQLIDRASKELPDPNRVLNNDVAHAYHSQMEWFIDSAVVYEDEDRLQVEKVKAGLVEKIVAHLSPDNDDAIELCLDLFKKTQSHEIEHQRLASLILDRALAITQESDRGPRFVERKNFFGFKVSLPKESVFEARRRMLEEQLAGDLTEHLKYRQPFVSGVVGLFNPEVQNALWLFYGQQLAGRGFVNGNYDTHAIQHVRKDLERFSEVAPKPIAHDTKQIIRARLRASSAL